MSEEKIKERINELYNLFKQQMPKSPEATTINKGLNALRYLYQENQQLKQQLKQRDEVIDKAIGLIYLYGKYDGEKLTRGFQMWIADFKRILDVLTKYKGDNNE